LVADDPRAELGALADLVYGHPTSRLQVLGITGTAGKTSVVNLIASGLRAAGRVPGVIGTVETRMGDLVVPSARTTPEAPDLHALFAVAIEHGVETVAMEVSSHALALGRVGGVRFAVGGFTNLGRDHLDFHADVEDYFAAKARLFDGRCATEVINIDDAAGCRLVAERPKAITYSARGNRTATWYATDIVAEGYGQRFVAHGPCGALSAGVALPGLHNVANALLATAVLVATGVEPAIAIAGVAEGTAGPGRLQRVEAGGEVIGVVDYAHKPEAVVEVLAALRRMAGRNRVICVIGAGGDRDSGKRPLLGKAAAAGSDLVVVTDDNPRTEDPAEIRAQVLAGARQHGSAEVVEVGDRRAAIAAAVAAATDGDVVALLGKGHELYQEIAGARLPFDDVVELSAALRAGGKA
jgi:UDP-N-acetylmuramoyl-L-alanyl-D-glutamate--2,6-diaminopimelate ligase